MTKSKLIAKIEMLKKERAEHIGRRKLYYPGSNAFYSFSRAINAYDARIDKAEFTLKYGYK